MHTPTTTTPQPPPAPHHHKIQPMAPSGNRQTTKARAERAWRLRCAGRTWPEIADAVGYKSKQSAMVAVNRLLAKDPPEDVGIQRKYTAEGYRIVQAALFESLAVAKDRKNVHEVVTVSRALTDVMERRAKLLGLHVPVAQQLDVNVHQTVSAVLERAQSDLVQAIESGQALLPIDAEVVDAEVLSA
jgi:hypothetical protein